MLKDNKITGKVSSNKITGKSHTSHSLGRLATKLLGLDFIWNGTQLGVKREGTQNYSYADLQGPQGPQGLQGPKGDTGAQGLQGIQGPKGNTGEKGDTGIGLEFNWNGTQLGVRNEGTAEYSYSNLQGPKGEKGEKGEQGEKGNKGDTGQSGYTPIKGIDYFTPNDKEELQQPITNLYDSTYNYSAGDYCIKDNTLYRCTTATTGIWNTSCWSATTMISEYKSAIKNIKTENINLLQNFSFNNNSNGQFYYNLQNVCKNNLIKKEIGYTTQGSSIEDVAMPTYSTVTSNTGVISTGLTDCTIYIWIKLTYSDIGKVVIISNKNEVRYTVYLSSGGGVACFDGDTKVLTTQGLIPIRDLRLNDEIITENGKKLVYKKYEHIVDKLFKIFVANEIIKCSYSHPFVTGRGMICAYELQAGDILQDKDGNKLIISKIETEEKNTAVYEINTKDINNYYVTEKNIMVGSEILM